MQLKKSTLDIDSEKIVCETLVKERNVVILHGAGLANRKRYYSLANAILQRGIGVVLFDFSGHGSSTGELKDLSLKRRLIQARGIINTFIPPESNFYLVGFSMSGQTVCDLLPMYDNRIVSILLGCPGIYAAAAQDIAFGSGEFTAHIRKQDSWKSSRAFGNLRTFKGRTIIAIGSDDHVIPRRVIDLLKKSAKHLVYREYPAVDHQLAVWLDAHEDKQQGLLDLLLNQNSATL